jgi:hypothetical protein
MGLLSALVCPPKPGCYEAGKAPFPAQGGLEIAKYEL